MRPGTVVSGLPPDFGGLSLSSFRSRARSNKDTVHAVNTALGKGATAVAARHLPSGDWALVFKTQADREAAQKVEGWPAKAFGVPAAARGKSYMVVARGLSAAAVRQAGTHIITQISREDDVRAISAVLPRRVSKQNPDITRSTLYVAVETIQ